MELLTVEEVAKRLKVDEETIRRWLRVGNLKGIKISETAWRIKDTELEKFLDSAKIEPDHISVIDYLDFDSKLSSVRTEIDNILRKLT